MTLGRTTPRLTRVLVTLVVFALGCSGGGDGGAPVVANDTGTGAGDTSSGITCTTDPLHTGLVAKQTGVSVDAFDCAILQFATKFAEPDPMIYKAIIYVESRFDKNSVACANEPCGRPAGWTTAETGCYGLMQIVPACGPGPNGDGVLSNGHTNLARDATSSDWAKSVFNPDVNVEMGISGVAGNRAQVVKSFPGCTVDQYTMMAIGNYNSYGSTKSCTVYNADYAKIVLAAYAEYSTAAGYAAHAY
jgi:hypothetical protein